MAVNPSAFGPKPQFVDVAGNPAISYQLFFYVAGSTSTKQDTFTDSTGLVANTNPIILNALGEPSTQIWWPAGQSFKVVLAPPTDTDPPSSPIWTIDNLYGINDFTNSPAQSEWVLSPLTPTFVNATTFTLPGNQTADFQISRRVKSVNTAGLAYGTIANSVFTTLTTVTLVNTSGVLDSGLSQVSYGLVSATNNSLPVASTTITGAVELATTAEVQTGTDTGRVPSVSSMQNGKSTLNAPILTTSGTAVNQTGIPAYAKRVRITFMGVSGNGTSPITVRLGTSGGVEATNYLGGVGYVLGAASFDSAVLATGFNLTNSASAAQVYRGKIILELADAATNTWDCLGVFGRTDTGSMSWVAGTKALAAVLDRIQVTTVGGVDTFDAGSISVMWE